MTAQLTPIAPAPAAYTFKEVQEMAQVIVQGNLFPSLKNPAQVLSLMLLCQAKGMHPMIAVERYHIIEGKPSMKADAMLSEFLSHGGRIEWQERSDTRVLAAFTAPNAGTVEVVWTIERARNAGLTGKGNWKSYPCQMLSARVISEGIGLTMPGVRMGIYTPEEVQDFDIRPQRLPSAPLPTYGQIDAAAEAGGGRGKVYRQIEPAQTVGETGEAITGPQIKKLATQGYPGTAAGWPSRKLMTKAQASQVINYFERHGTWKDAPGDPMRSAGSHRDPGTTTEATVVEDLSDPFAEGEE